MYHMIGDDSRFERAALKVLLLKDPRCCRIMFGEQYNFSTIYAYALGIASVVHDYRFTDAIKYRREKGFNYATDTNYTGTDKENIAEFFEYFNDSIVSEIRRYDCKNQLLLRKLDFSREEQIVRTEEERQQDVEELTELLNGVHDCYRGFVIGILLQVQQSSIKCREVIRFLKENPDVSASDIVKYVLDDLGCLQECHVAEPERYVDFGIEVDEDNYDCLGKWLCISNPKTGYGLFSRDTWTSDELLLILEKYV